MTETTTEDAGRHPSDHEPDPRTPRPPVRYTNAFCGICGFFPLPLTDARPFDGWPDAEREARNAYRAELRAKAKGLPTVIQHVLLDLIGEDES